jgi:hypothetical protein
MTAHLPPSLLALFAPRPPITFWEPPEKRPNLPYTGIAHLVSQFEDPTGKPEEPQRIPFETKKQRRERRALEKIKKHEEELQDVIKSCTMSVLDLYQHNLQGTLMKTLTQLLTHIRHYSLQEL